MPNSAGMEPVSWLSWRVSFLRCDRLPNCAGMEPVSWLLLRVNSWVREARSPNCAGMDPDSWLPWRVNTHRFARSPNESGIDPDSWLSWRARCSRRVRPPNSSGIEPVSALPFKSNCHRPVRRPNAAGMAPCRLAAGRRSSVTRASATVTPVQADMAVPGLQFRMSLLGPVRALSMVSRALQSWSRSALAAATAPLAHEMIVNSTALASAPGTAFSWPSASTRSGSTSSL